MIGLGPSHLVAPCGREHEGHEAASRLLEKEIAGRPGGCALAPQVLTEFLRVVTDSKRFEKPLGMGTALDLCDQWWGAEEVRSVAPTDEAGRPFSAWVRQHRQGRRRILGAFLAATYFAVGIKVVAITDRRDFSAFGVFEVRRIA